MNGEKLGRFPFLGFSRTKIWCFSEHTFLSSYPTVLYLLEPRVSIYCIFPMNWILNSELVFLETS